MSFLLSTEDYFNFNDCSVDILIIFFVLFDYLIKDHRLTSDSVLVISEPLFLHGFVIPHLLPILQGAQNNLIYYIIL